MSAGFGMYNNSFQIIILILVTLSLSIENAPVTRLVVIAIISLTVILGNHEISLGKLLF